MLLYTTRNQEKGKKCKKMQKGETLFFPVVLAREEKCHAKEIENLIRTLVSMVDKIKCPPKTTNTMLINISNDTFEIVVSKIKKTHKNKNG